MGEPPHVHERERNALLAPAADQLTCPQRSPAQPGWHSQPPETQSPLKPAQSAAVEQAAGTCICKIHVQKHKAAAPEKKHSDTGQGVIRSAVYFRSRRAGWLLL